MLCGIPTCNHPEKKYGVCGKHKGFAFKWNDPTFLRDLAAFEKLYAEYTKEADFVESQGYNILSIQDVWGYNLVGPRVKDIPPHFQKVYDVLEKIKEKTAEMMAKYDNALVYNAEARIRHKINPQPCCKLCSLKNH